MHVFGFVAVVLLDDTVKEFRELIVSLCTTGVNTDARVDVLATREDALLEGDATFVTHVLVLLPNFRSQMLAEQRVNVLRELREV